MLTLFAGCRDFLTRLSRCGITPIRFWLVIIAASPFVFHILYSEGADPKGNGPQKADRPKLCVLGGRVFEATVVAEEKEAKITLRESGTATTTGSVPQQEYRVDMGRPLNLIAWRVVELGSSRALFAIKGAGEMGYFLVLASISLPDRDDRKRIAASVSSVMIHGPDRDFSILALDGQMGAFVAFGSVDSHQDEEDPEHARADVDAMVFFDPCPWPLGFGYQGKVTGKLSTVSRMR